LVLSQIFSLNWAWAWLILPVGILGDDAAQLFPDEVFTDHLHDLNTCEVIAADQNNPTF
jgi:hypothetical protein